MLCRRYCRQDATGRPNRRTTADGKIEFTGLIHQVTDNISSQLQAKEITVLDQIEPGLLISLDEEQIAHVLQNLLTNAIKFSRPGGLIHLEAVQREDQLYIHIRDEGIGFDAVIGAQLFNRYTAGRGGTHGEKSTGVGLYLARKIMEQHKGTILAESAGPDKGAIFTLVFPLNAE